MPILYSYFGIIFKFYSSEIAMYKIIKAEYAGDYKNNFDELSIYIPKRQ